MTAVVDVMRVMIQCGTCLLTSSLEKLKKGKRNCMFTKIMPQLTKTILKMLYVGFGSDVDILAHDNSVTISNGILAYYILSLPIKNQA